MKLKLEQFQGEEPRTKTLAIPSGESFHARYYRVLNAAHDKNIRFHKEAIKRLEQLCAEFEEMLEITRGAWNALRPASQSIDPLASHLD